MSDIVNPDAPSVRPEKSAGAMLKEAREAAGLHIGALAVALKVPVRKLEALKKTRNRGFARIVPAVDEILDSEVLRACRLDVALKDA